MVSAAGAARALGFQKNPVGASAFVGFSSTTFCLPCKTFGFAYPGRQNVANLERYAK